METLGTRGGKQDSRPRQPKTQEDVHKAMLNPMSNLSSIPSFLILHLKAESEEWQRLCSTTLGLTAERDRCRHESMPLPMRRSVSRFGTCLLSLPETLLTLSPLLPLNSGGAVMRLDRHFDPGQRQF